MSPLTLSWEAEGGGSVEPCSRKFQIRALMSPIRWSSSLGKGSLVWLSLSDIACKSEVTALILSVGGDSCGKTLLPVMLAEDGFYREVFVLKRGPGKLCGCHILEMFSVFVFLFPQNKVFCAGSDFFPRRIRQCFWLVVPFSLPQMAYFSWPIARE